MITAALDAGSLLDSVFVFDNYGELLALLRNSVWAGAVLGLVGGLVGTFVMMRDLAFAVHGIAELSFAGAAAALLTEKKKAWRYRPFPFPLFSDSGNESAFHFDFYVYDYEDSVIKLIMVIPFESREVWDKVGRFKRQYPMYDYELWTPEKLAKLSGPRGRLEF